MLDIPAHTAGRRPLLLREPLHRSSLSAESLDFQVRVGRPDPSERGPQTPCVLVLTRTADREIDELSLALAAAGGPSCGSTVTAPRTTTCAGIRAPVW